MKGQFQELVLKSIVSTHGSKIRGQMSSQMIVRDQLSVETWEQTQLTADEVAFCGAHNLLLHRISCVGCSHGWRVKQGKFVSTLSNTLNQTLSHSKTLLLGSLLITSKCPLDAVVCRVNSEWVPLCSLSIMFGTDSRLSLDHPEPIHQILSGETESIASWQVVLNLKRNNNFSDPKL